MLWLSISYGQLDCPLMTLPENGAADVAINTSISWNHVDGALGYYLLIGTTSNGGDVANNIDVGNVTSYVPPEGLPEQAVIYVKISVYSENTFDTTCTTNSFTTGNSEMSPPLCTTLTHPQNGDSGVPVTTELAWEAVSGATGYRMIFYRDPEGNHIRDTMTYFENSTGEINLPGNTTFHIGILPFNEVGSAQQCEVTSFTTISECSHTINPIDDFYKCDLDGDSFEEFQIDLVMLERMLIGSQTGLAVSYHNLGGDLIDFSLGTQYALNQRGILARATNEHGCVKETTFHLNVVQPPTAPEVSNISECYEYALPELVGESQYFTETAGQGSELSPGETITTSQRVYIYAQAGTCSDESSFLVTIDPTLCDENSTETVDITFPKFFSPNNDGINDTWRLHDEIQLSSGIVQVFDRYGTLIWQFDTTSNMGWDGTSQGRPLPESDYWFRAVLLDGRRFSGHFTLKR